MTTLSATGGRRGRGTRAAAVRTSSGPRPALVALLSAVLPFSLLQTMVVPALDDLRTALDASPSAVSWVLSAFLLTSSVGTVILSRLGDIYGKKLFMVVSLAILALGTALAALAGSIGVLITARAVQGLGAATFPLAFAIVRDVFPRERVPVVIGTVSAVFGVGFGAGLVLPGPLLDTLGWPWIFWVALVVIVLALVLVVLFIPAGAARSAGRVDWAGAALFAVALTALLLAVRELSAGSTSTLVALVVAGLAALTAFALVERRTADPLIDLDVLRKRPVLVANAVTTLFGLAIYGAFSLVPQLVQTPSSAGYGFGASAALSGLVLLPLALTLLFAGPVGGRLNVRWGSRATLVLACCTAAAGFTVIMLGLSDLGLIAVGAAVLGVGAGFAFSAIVNLLVDSVAPHETGQATSVNTILRTVGGAVGAQVATAVLTSRLLPGSDLPARSGYVTAFAISAAALAAAALITLAAPSPGRTAGQR